MAKVYTLQTTTVVQGQDGTQPTVIQGYAGFESYEDAQKAIRNFEENYGQCVEQARGLKSNYMIPFVTVIPLY